MHIKEENKREPKKKVNSRREKQVSVLKAYGFESSVSRHAVVRSGAAGDGELGLGRARPQPPIDGLGSTLDLSHVDPLVRLCEVCVSSRATRKTNRGQFFARRLGKHLHRDRERER